MVEVFRGALSIDPPWEGSVVTLGTFDGVHRGHQALVALALEGGRTAGVPAVAYTFDPHPATVVAPRHAPLTLMPLDRRIYFMGKLGLPRVVVEPFDRALAAVEADDWVRNYLVERLRPRRVVVGFNFTYGRARGGDPDHLRRMGEQFGFEVDELAPVTVNGVVASSSRVRTSLLEGDVRGAAELLGRPFSLTGTVIAGDRRGRQIGFPTANVAPEGELVPKHGVYACRARSLSDASVVPEETLAVTNIGRRPTFDGGTVRVEAHLLDFSADLYGQRLEVELVERIREERKFDGGDELVTQVRQDVRRAREILGS